MNPARTWMSATLVLLIGTANAAPGDPAGAEFQVSTNPTVNRPDVAIDDDGNFVAVWQGAGGALWMQRHDSSGNRLGTESAVQMGTTNAFLPRVARHATDNYLVVWQGSGTGDTDGVFVRRFTPAGVALDFVPTLVNTTTAGFQGNPDIAISASGAFVVTWLDATGTGVIRAKRFDPTGVPGPEFTVSTNVTGNRSEPHVGMADNGAFVVVWQSDGDGDQSGIYMRRYDASGAALSGEVLVNSTGTTQAQTFPAVAMNASGAFVVTWFTWNGNQVLAQRYDSAGATTGTPLTVNAAQVSLSGPDVGIDDAGNFLVTWEQSNVEAPAAAFTFGIFARYYQANGTGGAVQQVNTSTTDAQESAAVAMDTGGNAVVVWETAHRVSNRDIFGRRYVGAVATDTTPDAFSFPPHTGSEISTVVTSITVTITGINAPAAISITGGEYSIGCTTSFTAAAGTISNGQSVCVRHTTAATLDTMTTTTLTIGGVFATFTSTTKPPDTTPNAFSFTAQTNVATSTLVTSSTVTITGINAPAAVSITGGEYSIGCTASFTTAAGTISNGQTVCVRHTSSANPDAMTLTTLTIGGVAATFSSTTTASGGGGGGGGLDLWLLSLLAVLLAVRQHVRRGIQSCRMPEA